MKKALLLVLAFSLLLGCLGGVPLAAENEAAPVLPVTTFVRGYAANIAVNLKDEVFPEGAVIKVRVTADDGKETFGPVVTVGADRQAIIRLEKGDTAYTFGRYYYVAAEAYLDGTLVSAKQYQVRFIWASDNIWRPEAVRDDEGRLRVDFDYPISHKTRTGIDTFDGLVSIDGSSEYRTYMQDFSITVDVLYDDCVGKTVKISGVKYSELFPSYSFTFMIVPKALPEVRGYLIVTANAEHLSSLAGNSIRINTLRQDGTVTSDNELRKVDGINVRDGGTPAEQALYDVWKVTGAFEGGLFNYKIVDGAYELNTANKVTSFIADPGRAGAKIYSNGDPVIRFSGPIVNTPNSGLTNNKLGSNTKVVNAETYVFAKKGHDWRVFKGKALTPDIRRAATSGNIYAEMIIGDYNGVNDLLRAVVLTNTDTGAVTTNYGVVLTDPVYDGSRLAFKIWNGTAVADVTTVAEDDMDFSPGPFDHSPIAKGDLLEVIYSSVNVINSIELRTYGAAVDNNKTAEGFLFGFVTQYDNDLIWTAVRRDENIDPIAPRLWSLKDVKAYNIDLDYDSNCAVIPPADVKSTIVTEGSDIPSAQPSGGRYRYNAILHFNDDGRVDTIWRFEDIVERESFEVSRNYGVVLTDPVYDGIRLNFKIWNGTAVADVTTVHEDDMDMKPGDFLNLIAKGDLLEVAYSSANVINSIEIRSFGATLDNNKTSDGFLFGFVTQYGNELVYTAVISDMIANPVAPKIWAEKNVKVYYLDLDYTANCALIPPADVKSTIVTAGTSMPMNQPYDGKLRYNAVLHFNDEGRVDTVWYFAKNVERDALPASISPLTMTTFVAGAAAGDQVLTLTPGSYTFRYIQVVKDGGIPTDLSDWNYYVYAGNTIIRQAYLNTLTPGTYTFNFVMNGGTPPQATLTVNP